MMYKLLKQRRENEEEFRKGEVEDQVDMKAARDRYVSEQVREMLYTMKTEEIPKGVAFSTLVMTAPLGLVTLYVTGLCPMATNPAIVDPAQYAYMCRSALRLLSLNLAFNGGIHYGFAAAQAETTMTDEEERRVTY